MMAGAALVPVPLDKAFTARLGLALHLASTAACTARSAAVPTHTAAMPTRMLAWLGLMLPNLNMYSQILALPLVRLSTRVQSNAGSAMISRSVTLVRHT